MYKTTVLYFSSQFTARGCSMYDHHAIAATTLDETRAVSIDSAVCCLLLKTLLYQFSLDYLLR